MRQIGGPALAARAWTLVEQNKKVAWRGNRWPDPRLGRALPSCGNFKITPDGAFHVEESRENDASSSRGSSIDMGQVEFSAQSPQSL
jgi:hypothetical protein